MNANHIIADRAEFIDALAALRRGHVLVRTGDSSVGCVLAGAFVHNVFPTLVEYRLIDEFDNPDGFPGVRYFRINDRGRDFADRAHEHWRGRGIWERLLVRLTG